MARNLLKPSSSIIFIFCSFFLISTSNTVQSKVGAEKMSHLHFYFHDTVTGANRTAVKIAPEETIHNSSLSEFGTVSVFDDPLTEGPELSSKVVGKAQGMYMLASQQGELAFVMAMNFAFVEGKYNGSTISILGRNMILREMREMPVVGGTGLFRFARGYAQAKTVSLNADTASIEFNVYVMHP